MKGEESLCTFEMTMVQPVLPHPVCGHGADSCQPGPRLLQPRGWGQKNPAEKR